jgi:hypothetical protein
MRKSQDKQTTAENLEEKFDRGEEVLDYFDLRKARVITPSSKESLHKTRVAYPVKRNSKRAAVVREKSARYRKKTG